MYSGEERQAKMNAMLEQMNDPDHKKAVAVADAAIERFTEADSDVSECSKLNDNNIPSERQLRKTQTAQAKQEFADAEAALKRLRGDFLAGTEPALDTAAPAPVKTVKIGAVVNASEVKPWLSVNPKDPAPEQPWYTPARYFARQLAVEEPTLLAKRELLAGKVSTALFNAGFKKRGGKLKFDSGTVLKAFANVTLG